MADPSYANGFATDRGGSAHPLARRDLVSAWEPAFGVQGSTLFDVVNGENPGVFTNMVTAGAYVPSNDSKMPGYVIEFDGVNDYINCGDIPELSGVTELTIMAWWRRNATNNRVLMGKRFTSFNAVMMEVWDDGVVYNSVRHGQGRYASFSSNDTDWHRYALVYNGNLTGDSERLKVWFDGVQKALSFAGSGSVPATTDTNTEPFHIGARTATAQSGANKMSDIRFYSRALTGAELAFDYEISLAPFRLKRSPINFVVPVAVGAVPHSVFHSPFAGPFAGAF